MASPTVSYQEWLFDEAEYRRAASSFRLDQPERERVRQGLERLQARLATNHFETAGHIPITEIRAQQAFNQTLFVEMLGYSGMTGPTPTYSLLPEHPFGKPSINRADVGIGLFSPNAATAVAVVEIKSFGTDLREPQGGQYKGQTPFEQALEACVALGVDWAVVTNFDDVCLMHRTVTTSARRFSLKSMSPFSVDEFYFAFGRGAFGEAVPGTPGRLQSLVK